MTFARITVRAHQMGGVPSIRGLRIPVATVVGMVADGMSHEEMLAAYPDLEPADITEVMRYAAKAWRAARRSTSLSRVRSSGLTGPRLQPNAIDRLDDEEVLSAAAVRQ